MATAPGVLLNLLVCLLFPLYSLATGGDRDGGLRERRYVGDVIARLADNYNKPTAYHGKETDRDLIYPLGNAGERRGSRKMEMVGNVAVPVPATPSEAENATDAPSKDKPGPGKKAAEPTKKPVNYKKVESAADASNTTEEEDNYTSISADDLPKNITDDMLLKNIMKVEEDHHIYYNSTFIVDSKIGAAYWVDMEKEKDVVVNKMLSDSHRRAATVKLSFDFPFYGHTVRNMTIATGGFMYTGDYIHSWLAATQYIAPLMANFDTSLSGSSRVKYRDNGTAFTVEWDRVFLQDKRDAGEFTFQVTIQKSGDIVFVYRDVPILVETIEDKQHPVKVGLSDAYIIDRTVFYVRRKTIYEYHKVNFKREDIRNWTVIYMSALPTCVDFKDCHSCLTAKISFACKWCPSVERCSTGYDRHRQEWLDKCEKEVVTVDAECDSPQPPMAESKHIPQAHNSPHKTTIEKESTEAYSNTTGMLGVVLTIAVISGLALWVLYAYRNPHTPSGQVLIKYRPSQWTLRRGEARYTAATIHM